MLGESFQIEENRIYDYQSQVWIYIEEKDGHLFMPTKSDAVIVSGLITLLLRIHHGRTPLEVATTSLDFLGEIGLLQAVIT